MDEVYCKKPYKIEYLTGINLIYKMMSESAHKMCHHYADNERGYDLVAGPLTVICTISRIKNEKDSDDYSFEWRFRSSEYSDN